jgi:hypothetical protein
MTNEPPDPLFDALSGLTLVAPRESHDRRVRRRCQATLASRRSTSERSRRSVRLPDIIGAAAVTIYVIAVVTEGVRLFGAAAG